MRAAPDTLELTFHLRRDIRRHGGAPISAQHVEINASGLLFRTAHRWWIVPGEWR